MKKQKPDRGSFTLKKRFQYWFDNRMTSGSLALIRILIIASVLLAVMIAGLIILLGFNESGETASVFWNSIATVLNAWMPYFEDGSPGYLILMSVIAVAGVLFTSVLIGIITSAIEEKISSLKKGNSLVLERDHIVVLGYSTGEYTLLQQLILAAGGKPTCIVIAEDMEREEMEQDIQGSLDIPKNVRIVCRTADITDPASLEKCSVETCKTIIVSPTDDIRTIKAILAVSVVLEEKCVPEKCVNAIISKDKYRFPPSLAASNNISTFETNSIIAKMIAHSCTQTGLSEVFREVFNFEGSEFYLADFSGLSAMSFAELTTRVDHGIPAGIFRDGNVYMNPPADFQLQETDRVLVFSEESDSAALLEASGWAPVEREVKEAASEAPTSIMIIGHNETLPVILHEMPENVAKVYLVAPNITEEEKEELDQVSIENSFALHYEKRNTASEKVLCDLAKMAEHIVLLFDHEKDAEEADMEAIFLLLRLRDIRKRYDLSFNITMEMQKEHNQRLVGLGDHTDFLVSSSMSSLILAQLAENPELIGVFRELLSNKGNELYLKNVGRMALSGKHTVRELRQIALQQGYILMGHLDAEKNSHIDLRLDEEIMLADEDHLIVLGQV